MYKSPYDSPLGINEQESVAWAVGWNDRDVEAATEIFNFECKIEKLERLAKSLYDSLILIESDYDPITQKKQKIWDDVRSSIATYEDIIK